MWVVISGLRRKFQFIKCLNNISDSVRQGKLHENQGIISLFPSHLSQYFPTWWHMKVAPPPLISLYYGGISKDVVFSLSQLSQEQLMLYLFLTEAALSHTEQISWHRSQTWEECSLWSISKIKQHVQIPCCTLTELNYSGDSINETKQTNRSPFCNK